jgi:predicted MFS family arabinose efflux permease
VGSATEPQKLWSSEFLALCVIIAAAFCNVSVFYSFYHYLGTIGIPVAWRGFLVGLEPMAAFALRLFVLPWLHVRNALSVTAASLVLLIAVSCSYLWVLTVPAMIVLRIIHGAAFVLLTSAVIALAVNFIPGEKSGQGFSALSIATMIPYAVIPPASEAVLPLFRTEADIYAGVSIFSAAALVLILALHGRISTAIQSLDGVLLRRPTLAEIRDNFRLRAVLLLLASILFVYLAHATFFYFLKDLSLVTGSGDVGVFFSVCMLTMIAVRVLGSMIFDRMNKPRLLKGVLVLLAASIVMIPLATSRLGFYLLAAVYGICMGVILPLLNALLFSVSPPPLRGLNTNLTLFALDAGYFATPYLGGAMVAAGAGFDILFYIGAGYVALALVLIAGLYGPGPGEREQPEVSTQS